MTLLVLFLPTAAAEAAPFNPDRPGYADSAGSVPAGHLMTEAGAQLTAAEGAASLDTPMLSIRGGLTDRLELRVSAPSVAVPLGDGEAALGASEVGAKYALSFGADTAVSVVAMVPLVPGPLDEALGSASFRVNASRTVSDIGVTLNGVVSPGEELGWAASAAAGYSAFYAQAALEGGGGEVSPLVGAGAAFTPLRALQLDVYVDALPTAGAVLVGAGVSRQW